MQISKIVKIVLVGLVIISSQIKGCYPTCVGPVDMYSNRQELAARKIFFDEEAYERLASLWYRRSFGQWLDICAEETDALQNTFQLKGLQYGQEVSRACHTVYVKEGYQAACEFLEKKKKEKETSDCLATFLSESSPSTQEKADSSPFADDGVLVTRQPAGECTRGDGLSNAQKIALLGISANKEKKGGGEKTPLIHADSSTERHCCVPDEDGCCWFIPLTRE